MSQSNFPDLEVAVGRKPSGSATPDGLRRTAISGTSGRILSKKRLRYFTWVQL